MFLQNDLSGMFCAPIAFFDLDFWRYCTTFDPPLKFHWCQLDFLHLPNNCSIKMLTIVFFIIQHVFLRVWD